MVALLKGIVLASLVVCLLLFVIIVKWNPEHVDDIRHKNEQSVFLLIAIALTSTGLWAMIEFSK